MVILLVPECNLKRRHSYIWGLNAIFGEGGRTLGPACHLKRMYSYFWCLKAILRQGGRGLKELPKPGAPSFKPQRARAILSEGPREIPTRSQGTRTTNPAFMVFALSAVLSEGPHEKRRFSRIGGGGPRAEGGRGEETSPHKMF